MEKIKNISNNDIVEGYFIEMTCCMCDAELTIVGDSKKECAEKIKDSGWKELNSDRYQIVGYYCGECSK